MTTAFVLDASVTLAWLRDSDATPLSRLALDALAGDSTAYVPTLWRYEVASVLVRQQRHAQLETGDGEEFLEMLEHLPIYEDDAWPSALSMVHQGLIHGLTGYDAAYLILAQRLALPLATLDQALRGAAQEAEIALL